ncbi:hypothetical protein HK405_000925 [Cladochytrium tenue]|nr:hypothetical protein HK405_000925 [Cladochytrium tenue]
MSTGVAAAPAAEPADSVRPSPPPPPPPPTLTPTAAPATDFSNRNSGSNVRSGDGGGNEDPTSLRVGRILSLLKSVEQEVPPPRAKGTGSSPPQRAAAAFDHAGGARSAIGGTAVEQSSASVFDGVKAKIIGQQVEIEEKTRTIAALREELKRLREASADQATQMKQDNKLRLTTQRKEFETVVNRHLAFIDKLLGEKDEISRKADALADEVKAMEKAFKEKLKTVEEQHARDLRQQRDLWQAAEKVKRDKWIAEKTKSIKDQTVKGLEPEIQRMLAQHKAQMRQIEEKAKEDMNRERAALAEASARQIESMRDKMIAERQKACEDEREFARQRYQKQLERDEMEFQQQKRKLQADFEDQKHYLSEEAKRARQADLLEHRKATDELRGALERLRVENDAATEELRRRHTAELAAQRERGEIEKQHWQEQYMARQEAEMRARDKQLREQLLKERDDELELIVQRLESETNSNASDIHRRFRMDVEKIRAEAAEEVKQLRDQHSLALDKVIAAQAALAKCEEERKDLQKQLLQTQHESQSKLGDGAVNSDTVSSPATLALTSITMDYRRFMSSGAKGEPAEVAPAKTVKNKNPLFQSPKRDRLRNYIVATMGSGNMRDAVKLPDGSTSKEEWLAVNTVDFFNQINFLQGCVSDYCTNDSCPSMRAGPRYEYLWADGKTVVKPIKCTAPEYTEHLLAWVEGQLDDEAVFNPEGHFPPNFEATVRTIFKRLFRFYAHVYHTHLKQLEAIGEDKHLNTCFKHFLLFTTEFKLIEDKELNALNSIVAQIIGTAPRV